MGSHATMGMALGCMLVTSGCKGFSPIPDARSPVDRAHELDVACRDSSDATAAALTAPSTIDSVEPLQSHVQSGNNFENRLLGARLHVRPLPGLTREGMTRELQCHEARVLLGGSVAPPYDPYSAAPAWVDLSVESEGNGFVVQVESFDFEVARTALDHARRYASFRPGPPPAPTPP